MDKANTFNIFFSSVFTREDMSHLPDLSRKRTQTDLDDVQFTSDDVLKQLLLTGCSCTLYIMG